MGQVPITLNGRGYRLSCGAGEEARLSELAADLNRRLERLAVSFGQHGDDRLLVMAALMLTDELLELKVRLASAESAAGSLEEPKPESSPSIEPDAGAPLEAPSSGKLESAAPSAAPTKAEESDRAAASPARATPQRNSLEARLAEARAGRPSATPKSGAA
jgi:cell division protein ZapA